MGAKDRLVELKNLTSGSIYNDTVEILPDITREKNVEEIFREVEKIREKINEINRNTGALKKLFVDPTFQTSANLQDQLDSAIARTKATALAVCRDLRQFENRLGGGDENGTAARVARLQYASARQLYAKALFQHESLLQNYRDRKHVLLQEQIKLTNLTISDEECQSLLDSNNLSLFVDNLQAETQEARLALQDVEARHNELIKIENSLKELRDLFVEMSHLVLQQQDLIDRVEYYALQATDYIEMGGKELLKGHISQRKARRKKISLILCISIGLVIIILVLILS